MNEKSEDSTDRTAADQAPNASREPGGGRGGGLPGAGVERAPPPYTLFEHTADLGFTLEAPDLERLLARGALAIHDIAADAAAARPLEERALAAEGADLPSLFMGFLEEAHWLFEGERFLLSACDPAAIDRPAAPGEPWRAHARVVGEPFDRARHEIRRPIKAVTWHELLVEEGPEGASARVILDL